MLKPHVGEMARVPWLKRFIMTGTLLLLPIDLLLLVLLPPLLTTITRKCPIKIANPYLGSVRKVRS